MMNICRIFCAVALAVIAAVCRGSGREGIITSQDGDQVVCQLDLSRVWDKRDLKGEPILWSSQGWGLEPEINDGETVTLEVTAQSHEGVETLESGLVGYRQTRLWTLDGAEKTVYTIHHVVKSGAVSDQEKTLRAYFSFENYEHVQPSMADVRAAICAGGDLQSYEVVNDPVNWWELVDGPGEGIEAPVGQSSLVFQRNGSYTSLSFDYTLGGGTWKVSINGGEPVELSASDGWSTVDFVVRGYALQTVEFITDLESDGVALLKNVRWIEDVSRFGTGQGSGAAVDLREGVRVMRRRSELLPFVYSSTNFTGLAEADGQSVARVSVVQLEGEGEALETWTPVTGSEKVLKKDATGEGSVVWCGKKGVWKAIFEIRDSGKTVVHTEEAVFDLRNLACGFAVLVY